MTKKKKGYIGEHLNIFKKKLQKISFKNSFACKSFFWGKEHAILFQSNPSGS
jgi:hypothetical protein